MAQEKRPLHLHTCRFFMSISASIVRSWPDQAAAPAAKSSMPDGYKSFAASLGSRLPKDLCPPAAPPAAAGAGGALVAWWKAAVPPRGVDAAVRDVEAAEEEDGTRFSGC